MQKNQEQEIKNKHIPIRMCKICRLRDAKSSLDRYVLDAMNKTYVLDNKKKIANRGFYICHSPLCKEKLAKMVAKGGIDKCRKKK